jgi:hypothetical protein
MASLQLKIYAEKLRIGNFYRNITLERAPISAIILVRISPLLRHIKEFRDMSWIIQS